MKFISLGRHCATAFNIKKYIDQGHETQFFDWVRTDFKCILEILRIKNIDEIINIENIIVDKELFKDYNISITFKNFVKDNLTLLFHHDIEYREYTEQEMNQQIIEFNDKYKRRYDRLIDLIKSEQKIYFIYHISTDVDFNDADLFNTLIKTINKNINYVLIFLTVEEKEYIYSVFKNYVKINLNQFISNNETVTCTVYDDWTLSCYDWSKMFELIQQKF